MAVWLLGVLTLASKSKSSRIVPKKGVQKPASKTIKKSVPTKSTARAAGGAAKRAVVKLPSKVPTRAGVVQLRAQQKVIQQQTRELAALARAQVSAKRSLSASRKRESKKLAQINLQKVDKELRRYEKQFTKNVGYFGKLIDAVSVKKRVPKKKLSTIKATATKARSIVTQAAQVTATKSTKKIPKKTVKKVVKKTKQYSVGFHPVPEIRNQILSPAGPTSDGKEMLDRNQMFSLKVHGNMGNEAYPTLYKMHEKATEYLERKVPQRFMQFGVYQMPERARATNYYAAMKENERAERVADRAEKQALKEEITQLRKELAAERAAIKAEGKRKKKGK